MLHRPEYIEVKAPAGFSLSSVRKIVLQKSPWILKKLEGFAGSVPRTLSRNYSPGELFYYLGSAMTLNIRRDAENLQVAMNENMITVSVHGDVREQAIRDHVKKRFWPGTGSTRSGSSGTGSGFFQTFWTSPFLTSGSGI